jgi:hypothetical protein
MSLPIPFYNIPVTIINTLVAIIIGILFGALGDFQTVISGGLSGMMAGIMGPIPGAMADKPFLLLPFITTLLSLFSFVVVCFSVSLEEGEQGETSKDGMERGKD